MARPIESIDRLPASVRRTVARATLITGLLAVPSLAYAAAPQDTTRVLVRVEDRTNLSARNRIVLRDAQGADKDVYRSDGTILGEVTLSPDGRLIALVEVVGDEPRPEKRLVVLDVAGRVVRTISDKPIVRYAWCGVSRMALILGGGVDEGVGFMPKGVSLVDVLTGLEQHLEGIALPYQLYWASFDSSLYIKGFAPRGARGAAALPPVYRYHAPTGRLTLTTHRGTFFSPDGLYYFDPSVEGSEFRLYRASDDHDVTGGLQLSGERGKEGPEFGWMPGAGHALLFVDRPARPEPRPGQPRGSFRRTGRNVPQVYPDRWNLVVDAETGRVVDRFQGDLGAGWKTNGAVLPVERRTGVQLIPSRRP